MGRKIVDVIYEDGVFKPLEKVEFKTEIKNRNMWKTYLVCLKIGK